MSLWYSVLRVIGIISFSSNCVPDFKSICELFLEDTIHTVQCRVRSHLITNISIWSGPPQSIRPRPLHQPYSLLLYIFAIEYLFFSRNPFYHFAKLMTNFYMYIVSWFRRFFVVKFTFHFQKKIGKFVKTYSNLKFPNCKEKSIRCIGLYINIML